MYLPIIHTNIMILYCLYPHIVNSIIIFIENIFFFVAPFTTGSQATTWDLNHHKGLGWNQGTNCCWVYLELKGLSYFLESWWHPAPSCCWQTYLGPCSCNNWVLYGCSLPLKNMCWCKRILLSWPRPSLTWNFCLPLTGELTIPLMGPG